jgi:hypothetical protein
MRRSPESANKITAHNARSRTQFRIRGSRRWPGVCEFHRWRQRMSQCHSCGDELPDKTRRCPRCGAAVPREFHLYQHPAVIVMFVICCAICFGFLRVLAELPVWLSVVLSVPIVVAFFAAMVRIASWSDCRDERR